MKNKNLRKTLLLLPFLALTACQSPTSIAQIFIYDSTDTFIGSLRLALEKNLDGYLPYNDNHYAERKQTTQNEQTIEALNDSRTKILVMNTVDRLASSALIEKAEKKNVPIIFFNREPLVSDFSGDWAKNNCFYVGSDPAVEGRLQADIANQLFGGAASYSSSGYDKNGDGIVDVAILKGEQGHQDTEQRSENCISRLRSLGYNVNIIESTYCNWERSVAKETMKSFYKPSIELLFSNNDDMALGAIDYLKELDGASSSSVSSIVSSGEGQPFAQRYFPIIGVDDTKAGQAAIDAGTLAGTVLNNASKQANVIFDLIQHVLDQKAIPNYPAEEVVPSGNFYHVLGQIVRKK